MGPDQAVADQGAQLGGERLLADALDALAQLEEAHRPRELGRLGYHVIVNYLRDAESARLAAGEIAPGDGRPRASVPAHGWSILG